MKNYMFMKNENDFTTQQSVARLRATIGELDQLINAEKDKTALAELRQLRDRIATVLEQLIGSPV
jgi:hypothetical protein